MTKHIATFSFGRVERLIRRHIRLSGLWGALISYGLAMTPSLLPRPPFFMGFIAGFASAVGYGLGIWLVWFAGRYLSVRIRQPNWHRRVWRYSIGLAPLSIIGLTVQGAMWQNDVRVLVGYQVLPGWHLLTIFGSALGFAIIILLLAKSIRLIYSLIDTRLVQRIPRYIANSLAVIAVGVLIVFIFNGLLFDACIDLSNHIYSARNQSTPTGVQPTTSTLRSGGPNSYVSWPALGYMGKQFVTGGPTTAQISRWSQRPAQEQIRVYAGLISANTPAARAQLVLKELQRTNAFQRKYLVIATPTGTGWIEPRSADTIDYITNGNSAIASMQYSYLPSWLSFLVNRQDATRSGQILFDTIYSYWSQLPTTSRPQLVSFGLSLGSFGGQAAFSGLADITTRTDGALFLGTPNSTGLWRTITDNRVVGSPEVLPLYGDNSTIRFAATPTDINSSDPAWHTPRILYLQHANDPIVWWSPRLILQQPDWLKEPRAAHVSPKMQWIPGVTFMQVTVDQIFGLQVPDGSGHNYGATSVAAWHAIFWNLPWTNSQYQSLQTIITSYNTTKDQ